MSRTLWWLWSCARRLDPAFVQGQSHFLTALRRRRSLLVVRRYEELIEVRPAQDGTGHDQSAEDGARQCPGAFIWRGRLYVVRAVLDHWQERRPWWRDARDGADVLADARERQVWRVEASAGRAAGVGVYDLGAVTHDHDLGRAGDLGTGHRDDLGTGHRDDLGTVSSQWRLLQVAD
ncbi:DUF6504 family protein [Pedococcus sp. 5OH_020]|uniref:DUF6504 family protein n=1 Tax=Pedococcus sp. 5OH_020 TaxID=2989814 RepID=UPI0022E99EBB|nr:DUF6504 family protein [Pedococcus sp. 5OH_020]